MNILKGLSITVLLGLLSNFTSPAIKPADLSKAPVSFIASMPSGAITSSQQPYPEMDPLVVPLDDFEIAFTDYFEGPISGGSSCLTRGVTFTNKGDRPINIFLYIVNQSNEVITLESGELGGGKSVTVSYDLGVLLLGGAGSTPGWVLPYSSAAIYPPTPTIIDHKPIVHPCDGYLGIVVAGNGSGSTDVTTTEEPESNEPPQKIETTTPQSIESLSPTSTQEYELTALMYVLFTGSLDGFEDTPEGQALTADQRLYVRQAIEAMGLLGPIDTDTFVYPRGHPCEGLTSRNLCEDKKKRDALQAEIDRAAEEISQQYADRLLRSIRVNQTVQEEISGAWNYLQYVYEYGGVILSPTPVQAARDVINDKIKGKITEQIENRVAGDIKIPSYDDVIKQGIDLVKNLATKGAERDYAQYLEYYQAEIHAGENPEKAHQLAMEKLGTDLYGKGRYAFVENGSYDRAFQRLNRLYGGE